MADPIKAVVEKGKSFVKRLNNNYLQQSIMLYEITHDQSTLSPEED